MEFVTTKRKYGVISVAQAKSITFDWLKLGNLSYATKMGLPEVDDRYHVWRVPILNNEMERVGEVVIDAFSSLVLQDKTTKKELIEARLLGRQTTQKQNNQIENYVISSLRNTVALGDAEEILAQLPTNSVDLVFTSPPYFNARPEYTDYVDYEDYLLKMRKIIREIYRVLNEGRFFVLNVSPVLVRRTNRSESSKRLAVPFDFHRIFIEEGFDFVDDIVWVKPEGAGWATGRGRRFAADRQPLQYKPVPVTEYVLVYRKHTDKLIDWNIRKHPEQDAVKRSKITGEYEKTNVWRIKPAHSSRHPAIFPSELASKVIQYYSFIGDVVLDPFAGIGTVGEAASRLGRRFVLIEIDEKYGREICKNVEKWLGKRSKEVFYIGVPDFLKPKGVQLTLDD